MKVWLRIITVAALVTALAVPLAQGQRNRRAASSPSSKYNPAAEIRVKGTIREVTFFVCPVSGGTGAHLRLDAAKQPVEVHLAPSWFIERYGMKFALGEKVEVIGVEYSRRGEAGLMARQVERARSIYSFRDPEGKPLWLPE